jgi:DNA-binding MarR family transcriptional regulator
MIRKVRREPPELEIKCACAAVRQAARVVTQIYEEELRQQLPMPQFGLLSLIDRHPGCNQATLAGILDFDKTTLSRNLKLLAKNGWIGHARSDDQRERGYHLTAGGAKLLKAAKPGWKRAQKRLRSAMTGGQWEAMWRTFGNITRAARESRKKLAQPRPH